MTEEERSIARLCAIVFGYEPAGYPRVRGHDQRHVFELYAAEVLALLAATPEQRERATYSDRGLPKELVRKVYEGDVIQSVNVLSVTLSADPGTVARYQESLARLKQSLARLGEATRMWRRPDEKDVIDQE